MTTKTKQQADARYDDYFRLYHSSGVKIGNMICEKCGEKIVDELYLERYRDRIGARGNEMDKVYIYHISQKCSEFPEIAQSLIEEYQRELVIIATPEEMQQAKFERMTLLATECFHTDGSLIVSADELEKRMRAIMSIGSDNN